MTGWLIGVAAVFFFSGSLPSMKLALLGFDPWFVAAGRAATACLAGLPMLALTRSVWPRARDLPSLAVVVCGVVFGFPLLSAMAMQEISAPRSIAWMGLLPTATALFAMLRVGERPRRLFWFWSLAGGAILVAYSVYQGGRGSLRGDLLMGAAILACGLGYAEGGRLARRLGGWQVICWALILAAPISMALILGHSPSDWGAVPVEAWAGLAYAALFSMFLGMLLWYQASQMAGTSAIGLLQLAHPFIGVMMARAVIPEPLPEGLFLALALVIVCVLQARRHV